MIDFWSDPQTKYMWDDKMEIHFNEEQQEAYYIAYQEGDQEMVDALECGQYYDLIERRKQLDNDE